VDPASLGATPGQAGGENRELGYLQNSPLVVESKE